MALAIECGVYFFFKNFTYTFAGEKFLQMFGGPIGARLTMAVARLVMQEWKDTYDKILEASKIEELLSALYVDDGRTMHRKLFYGERFDRNKMKFTIHAGLEEIDRREKIDRNVLTKEEVNKAMNAVNTDLKFTMELAEEFEDKKLPTLSFSIWPEKYGIAHTYFEKSMRNQVLMVERSSIGQQAKINIMS